MAYFRKQLAEQPVPGTEQVRIVVFRPGASKSVLRVGGGTGDPEG